MNISDLRAVTQDARHWQQGLAVNQTEQRAQVYGEQLPPQLNAELRNGVQQAESQSSTPDLQAANLLNARLAAMKTNLGEDSGTAQVAQILSRYAAGTDPRAALLHATGLGV